MTEGWNYSDVLHIQFYAININFNVPIKWQYSDNLWQFCDTKMTKLNENSSSHKHLQKRLMEILKISGLQADWVHKNFRFDHQ